MFVKGKTYEMFDEYLKYKKKQYEIVEKEYEDQFNDYRDEEEEGKQKYINEKLSNLRLHKLIEKRELTHLLWDFDAVRLHPSAMWDEKSIYLRIETGYAYTEDINDELVSNFNNVKFNQRSARLKIKNYNPKNLIVRHLPVKEKRKENRN